MHTHSETYFLHCFCSGQKSFDLKKINMYNTRGMKIEDDEQEIWKHKFKK